jgi:hypothetical protein
MALTPAQVYQQQKADAERRTAEKKAAAKRADVKVTENLNVPATIKQTALPAVADDRPYTARYIDEIAPATLAGPAVKFNKHGQFMRTDTEEVLGDDVDYTALCDETLISWVKFSEDGGPPERVGGLLYDGFVLPPRASLGDDDPAKWPMGLDGRPTDRWIHQICLVLQEPKSGELFTFITNSRTGRRAVGNLLRHYDRLRKSHPDHYPAVKLKTGGFMHKDERIGFVATPSFAVVGRVPKDSAAVPDTSTAADLDDAIPF